MVSKGFGVRKESRAAKDSAANNYCWVCRFDGEMIVEVRAYLDSAMVDYTIHRNEISMAVVGADAFELYHAYSTLTP